MSTADADAETTPQDEETDGDEIEVPERPDPQAITREPATLSSTLAIVAAATVGVLSALLSIPALGASVLGTATLAVGVTYGRRGLVDLGGVGLLLGTILVAMAGVEYVALLAAVGSVLAWDIGNNAIEVGEQLGREADTERVELLHAGATLSVGVLTAGTSYVIYQAASGGQPVTAVFFLLLAAVALISSLRL